MRFAHPAIPFTLAVSIALAAAGVASDVAAQSTWRTEAGVVADTVTARARTALASAARWARDGYARHPAVMLGLAGALVLPPLAMLGLLLHRRRPERDDERRPAGGEDEPIGSAAAAFLEIDGARRVAMPVSRDIIQIGRQDDNDVCIDDDTVHRYHAVIERSPSEGFVIVDISGPGGNGVKVNGERRTTSVLANGDLVEVGRSRLRFAMAA